MTTFKEPANILLVDDRPDKLLAQFRKAADRKRSCCAASPIGS